jgi:hypothetical protein
VRDRPRGRLLGARAVSAGRSLIVLLERLNDRRRRSYGFTNARRVVACSPNFGGELARIGSDALQLFLGLAQLLLRAPQSLGGALQLLRSLGFEARDLFLSLVSVRLVGNLTRLFGGGA